MTNLSLKYGGSGARTGQWKAVGAKPRAGSHVDELGCRHVVLFAFVLVIYVCTAMPSVPGGDAGELLAEGCQLGRPHPPGEDPGSRSDFDEEKACL